VSVVVERGLARCPRCVAVADYTFVESGPNSLRYEVRCKRCGQAYCEVHTPVVPDFSAAADALAIRAPVVAAPVGTPYRQRITAAVTAGRSRMSRDVDRATTWIAAKRTALRR
jgi:hypothetical protein